MQKARAGEGLQWRNLLFFQERIQGPKNAPIARFDGLGCYQSRSEIDEGLRSADGLQRPVRGPACGPVFERQPGVCPQPSPHAARQRRQPRKYHAAKMEKALALGLAFSLFISDQGKEKMPAIGFRYGKSCGPNPYAPIQRAGILRNGRLWLLIGWRKTGRPRRQTIFSLSLLKHDGAQPFFLPPNGPSQVPKLPLSHGLTGFAAINPGARCVLRAWFKHLFPKSTESAVWP